MRKRRKKRRNGEGRRGGEKGRSRGMRRRKKRRDGEGRRGGEAEGQGRRDTVVATTGTTTGAGRVSTITTTMTIRRRGRTIAMEWKKPKVRGGR